MSANLIEELILLVSKQQKELASLNSKVETLEHQLFLFRNARFGRKSEKDAESSQLSLIPVQRKPKVVKNYPHLCLMLKKSMISLSH